MERYREMGSMFCAAHAVLRVFFFLVSFSVAQALKGFRCPMKTCGDREGERRGRLEVGFNGLSDDYSREGGETRVLRRVDTED